MSYVMHMTFKSIRDLIGQYRGVVWRWRMTLISAVAVNTEAISPAANLLTSSIASPNITTVAVTSVADVTSVTSIVTPVLQSAAINQQGKSHY